MTKKLRFALVTEGFYFIVLGIWLLHSGYPTIATLCMLPGIAILLISLPIPPAMAEFAFFAELAGPRWHEHEPLRNYYLKTAMWWFFGALSCPVSLALFELSASMNNLFGNFEAVLLVPIPVFGVACFIKSLSTLYLSIRLPKEVLEMTYEFDESGITNKEINQGQG